MRQCYYTLEKLTKRQLTVDCLRKLRVRKVGTNEVEGMAMKIIKGEGRRNPKIVLTLLEMKLEDAMRIVERQRKQFMREKLSLYMTINRKGMIKEKFWSKVDVEMKKLLVDEKKKNQKRWTGWRTSSRAPRVTLAWWATSGLVTRSLGRRKRTLRNLSQQE